jgi:adenosine deaminase
MTIERFVRGMPKVEVNLQFEGAIQHETLIVIAEQNDVPFKNKRFKNWVKQLEQVEYASLNDLIKEVSKWVQQPEDFTRIVYEIGVSLAKQNVQYAEIGFAPSLYADNGLTFEQLLTALNDGRERVQRAWNVQLRWIINGLRDEPQSIDDAIKWASGSAGVKGGIVGIGLTGREGRGWADSFERPFRTAQKKNLLRIVNLPDGSLPVSAVIERFEPDRVEIGLATAADQESIQTITDRQTAVGICMAQGIAKGSITTYDAFPLRRLVDDGSVVHIGAGMPVFYRTTLTQEYLAALQYGGLAVHELEQISLNALQASFMPDERKAEMRQAFKEVYASLRDEQKIDAESTF